MESIKKVLVVMKGESRCLVINEGKVGKPLYRLPWTSEISPAILRDNDKKDFGKQLVALMTSKEISPWDLLDPFPPEHYEDYAYMELAETDGNPDWEVLNTEDKNLIEKSPVKDLLKNTH